MKPLHTSSQVTASDSRMVVRVMEISTPDGPVRRIVVEANAEMDTTEARWLRDKLDLAITLAESTEPVEGDRITRFLDAWRQEKERFEPAVSEDQPKPRVWHRGDAPGPLRYSVVNVARLVVTEEFAATTFVMRKLGMSFAAAEAALSCLETWGVVRPTTGSKSRDVADIPVEQLDDLVAELNQVLADSEQVTR